MKTKEEIKKKRDFLNNLLEQEEEDISLGTLLRRKIILKIQILEWVLNEEPKISKDFIIPNTPTILDSKTKILKFFEENKDKWFTTQETSQYCNLSDQTSKSYLRELAKSGYLKFKIKYGIQGTPRIYQLK